MCLYCEVITAVKIMNISTTLKINLPSITIYKILEFYINEVIQYTLLGGVLFLSCNLVILIFMHTTVCINSLLLIIAE